MTDDALLAQAAARRAEADRLLHRDGLLAAIAAAGPAAVIGSYALDLITWADLDVSRQLPHEHDVAAFFDFGRAIARSFVAIRMSFSNQFIRPDVSFDHGLYWGIRLAYGGREWKVDLWGYGPEVYRAHLAEFEALRARLAAADRLAILRVKDAVCRRPAYRRDVSSVDVYEVATLIAGGRTNRQIAAELVVTEATAARHVEHIPDKLGVASRAQIAAWAVERGPRSGAPG